MRKMLKGDFCNWEKINVALQREDSCVTLCWNLLWDAQHREEQDILNLLVMVTDYTEKSRREQWVAVEASKHLKVMT